MRAMAAPPRAAAQALLWALAAHGAPAQPVEVRLWVADSCAGPAAMDATGGAGACLEDQIGGTQIHGRVTCGAATATLDLCDAAGCARACQAPVSAPAGQCHPFKTRKGVQLAMVVTCGTSPPPPSDPTPPPPPAPPGTHGPCDIYDAAGTPCVAAHSVVRSLYRAYAGPLYTVSRASDGAVKDISVVSAGGVADAAAQDAFCGGSACTIERIYDQSQRGNHLATAPPGSASRQHDNGVNAAKSRLTVGGRPAYGAVFEGGMGYRNDKTSGVATGDDPESMYMVTSGKYYNSGCCFDYGNAETDNIDDGRGTMECIYWGSAKAWGGGVGGSGPHVMADLEAGVWGGNETANPDNTPIVAEFVTAMLKGRPGGFALKGGDAQSGKLRGLYEGRRPQPAPDSGGHPCGYRPGTAPCTYNPMKKQGGIILGIGGDNSNGAHGVFYEGVMTSGYSSDATDDAVQASIVAAGYGK